MHVNIGDAKTRLSELVAAAVRGEEVVLDKAGAPQVQLVPVERLEALAAEARAARRRAAFGMYKDRVCGREIDVAKIKREDVEYQEAIRRKYGDPD